MSKSDSHQFIGTVGQKISQGMDPKNQKQKLLDWANDMAKYLSSKSKRQRDKFKTATVIFDETTGKLYFGRNGGIPISNPHLHPKMKELLPDKSLNGYPTPWNCSEADGINQALFDGALLKNLHIYTIDTTISDWGKDKKSCENCTYAYRGRVKKNNTGWFK